MVVLQPVETWFVCKSMETYCCDGWGAEVAASSAFTLDHAVWLWVARAHGPVFPLGVGESHTTPGVYFPSVN